MIFLERVVCPDLGNSRELRCVFFSKIETSRNLKMEMDVARRPQIRTHKRKRKPSPADQNNRNIVFIFIVISILLVYAIGNWEVCSY